MAKGSGDDDVHLRKLYAANRKEADTKASKLPRLSDSVKARTSGTPATEDRWFEGRRGSN